MRSRPSARLLIFDEHGRLLLFRFAESINAPDGPSYWATPGGGLEGNETNEQAAHRELLEETGLTVENIGAPVAERDFVLQLVTGETVLAQERYFAIQVRSQDLSRAGWSELEKQVMLEHRWWSRDEMQHSTETIYPENLLDLLQKARL